MRCFSRTLWRENWMCRTHHIRKLRFLCKGYERQWGVRNETTASSSYAYFALLEKNLPFTSCTYLPPSTGGHGTPSTAYIELKPETQNGRHGLKFTQLEVAHLRWGCLVINHHAVPASTQACGAAVSTCDVCTADRCGGMRSHVGQKKRAERACVFLFRLASNMTQLPLTWSSETISSYVPIPPCPAFIRHI